MTDKIKLEIAIIVSGLTKHEVAEKLGLSDMGFYKKINNITEFKASEIVKLKEILKLEAIEPIFFANKVELNSTKRD